MVMMSRAVPYLVVLIGFGFAAAALWAFGSEGDALGHSGGFISFLLGVAGVALIGCGLTMWLRIDDRRRRRYRRRR